MGGNTCMSWIWALHRYPPCAPCHEVCQLCGSDRLGGLSSMFWDAHLMPKGSTRSPGTSSLRCFQRSWEMLVQP